MIKVIVPVFLAVSIGVVNWVANIPAVPLAHPLSEIPTTIGQWYMVQQSKVSSEEQELLRAGDTVLRSYRNAKGEQVSLLVAFFATQRGGAAPHSPKVCLPSGGWQASESTIESLKTAGSGDTVSANRYIVSLSGYDAKQVVLYWFQTHNQSIATEFGVKSNTLLDAFLRRRSDIAFVRVISPETKDDAASRFVAEAYPVLRPYLPL